MVHRRAQGYPHIARGQYLLSCPSVVQHAFQCGILVLVTRLRIVTRLPILWLLAVEGIGWLPTHVDVVGGCGKLRWRWGHVVAWWATGDTRQRRGLATL